MSKLKKSWIMIKGWVSTIIILSLKYFIDFDESLFFFLDEKEKMMLILLYKTCCVIYLVGFCLINMDEIFGDKKGWKKMRK